MCKHVAATLYGVGARLDAEPELFFRLRRVDQLDLLAAAGNGVTLAAQGGGTRKRIAETALGEVFGIELDTPSKASDALPGGTTPGSRRKIAPATNRALGGARDPDASRAERPGRPTRVRAPAAGRSARRAPSG
jgi:hypothetical protein